VMGLPVKELYEELVKFWFLNFTDAF
jgi:hypothetical protein